MRPLVLDWVKTQIRRIPKHTHKTWFKAVSVSKSHFFFSSPVLLKVLLLAFNPVKISAGISPPNKADGCPAELRFSCSAASLSREPSFIFTLYLTLYPQHAERPLVVKVFRKVFINLLSSLLFIQSNNLSGLVSIKLKRLIGDCDDWWPQRAKTPLQPRTSTFSFRKLF